MKNNQSLRLNQKQIILITVTFLGSCFILFTISRYWYADTLYAKAKNLTASEKPKDAEKLLTGAIAISPKEPLYHLALSEAYTNQAISSGDKSLATKAIEESQIAIELSPRNVNLVRSRFSTFIRLTLVDPAYLGGAIDALEEALILAPTDAKLYYNLGLSLVRAGKTEEGLKVLGKAVELKANYRDARLAYALLLIDKGERLEAKKHLEYILEFIEPNDSIAKQTLEEIK